MLQAPLRKLKLGQGVKGGIKNPLDAPSLIPKLDPTVPHIRAPKAPPINYGAVAQQRRLPTPQRSGLSPAVRKQLASSPSLEPTTPAQNKQLKLQAKQQRLGIGKYKPVKAGPGGFAGAAQSFLGGLMDPISSIEKAGQDTQHAVAKMQTAMEHKPTPQQQKLQQAGLSPMPHGVGGWTQNLLTEVGQTAIGVGPGLYHLGGGLIHDPVPTTAALAKAFAHSVGQTIHHPIRQLQQDPLGFITNVLMPVAVTAGTAARVSEMSRTAAALRAGEITKLQAISKVGKTLLRPQPQQRSLTIGGGPGRHFNADGFDTQGFHKTNFSHPDVSRGHRMPILFKPSTPESAMIGPQGLGHEDMGMKWAQYKSKGFKQASANINPDTGRVEDLHIHGNLPMTDAKLKVTKQKLMNLANEKLIEANHQPFRIEPPAFKGALGGYLQTKLIDPLTEKAVTSSRLKGAGQKVTALGREFRLPNTFEGLTPSGHLGKLIRRHAELDMQMSRGAEEQKILEHMKPGGALHGMEPEKAQALAHGRGAAKAHMRLWHSLYNGAAGADETIASNPRAYVGIRKPPEQVKWKAYRGDAGIARQWQSMIETDPAKLAADPHAYSYIPRGTWQRMKLYEPGKGHLVSAFDAIDRGTQMIRIGRFLHPGYAAWAAQNGILHLSQAGMFAFRNAWQLRHDYSRLTPHELAIADNSVGAGHFGGGIARATMGSGKFSGTSRKLGGFWHAVDDRYWRRMSLIHELNHAGYHSAEDWGHLMRTNMPRFQAIAMKAQDQAINYAEMSPAERATLQKLFTAWGWTRGASTYTLRYPLESPVKGVALEQIGQEGKQRVENFYAGKNGMVPNWLRGFLPIGHSDHPFLAEGDLINPAATLGNLIGELPGATKGQTESLSQEEAPVPAALQEIISGTDRYGNALKPGKRLSQPLGDLAKRFEPWGALQTALTSKKGGGTLKQGPLEGLERFSSIPISQLNDAQKTAALGMKDYEQALSRPDQINFRYNLSVHRLRQESQLFHKHGADVSTYMIGKVKGDLEAVHTRDLFQYHYASAHGANSYRSLPATNKVHAAITFLAQHHYIDPGEVSMYTEMAKNFKTDAELERMATELWHSTGIGGISNSWANSVKRLRPSTLTPARG